MSGNGAKPFKHLSGLGISIISLVLILWAWRDGLGLLNGTVFSELRYLVFGGFVVLLLTAINRITERFFL